MEKNFHVLKFYVLQSVNFVGEKKKYFFQDWLHPHTLLSIMSLTAANVADMKNSASKITGLMTCISANVNKLEECKTFREDCAEFIAKAKKLLLQKQAEMMEQIKQVQDFLGPTPKRAASSMNSFYDEASGIKKPKLDLGDDLESMLSERM
jgi:hypothetical protein